MKGCVIPEQLALLLLIKQKNHNKRFGEFEYEYFGDSDVVNKLLVTGLLRTLKSLNIFSMQSDIELRKVEKHFFPL